MPSCGIHVKSVSHWRPLLPLSKAAISAIATPSAARENRSDTTPPRRSSEPPPGTIIAIRPPASGRKTRIESIKVPSPRSSTHHQEIETERSDTHQEHQRVVAHESRLDDANE